MIQIKTSFRYFIYYFFYFLIKNMIHIIHRKLGIGDWGFGIGVLGFGQ